jgi:carboxylesterase type B
MMMLENECKYWSCVYTSLHFPIFSYIVFLDFILPLSNLCVAGVCHADDIGYLFHIGMLDLDLDPSTPEFKTLSRMVKLWTNFAKTG